MIYYDSPSNDAFFNMALEEALLEQPSVEDGCLLLWQNKNAVVVGRHQNTFDEIDPDVVQKEGIQVVRRLSGGGAMYQDLGNLNFTFVVEQPPGQPLNFSFFTTPVVRALNSMGVAAQAAGRNDILVGGKKVSGNAQLRRGRRVLHHGTLLFNSRLAAVAAALRGKPRANARGVASVRSRVANIAEHLHAPMALPAFKALLVAHLQLGNTLFHAPLPPVLQAHAERLRGEKYATDAWNYGAGPAWNLRRERRYAFGNVCVLLNTAQNIIADARIYGDFFGGESTLSLTEAVRNLPLEAALLEQALAPLDVAQYIHGMDAPALAALIAENGG